MCHNQAISILSRFNFPCRPRISDGSGRSEAHAGKEKASARLTPMIAREKITKTYRFPQANFHKDSSMLFGTIGSHFPGLELLEINSPSPIFPEWVEI
jgi:hypothetical protein